jgi:transcription initiation factor TFIIIB Brf1 subunit/transcription initiation factor TFIIB
MSSDELCPTCGKNILVTDADTGENFCGKCGFVNKEADDSNLFLSPELYDKMEKQHKIMQESFTKMMRDRSLKEKTKEISDNIMSESIKPSISKSQDKVKTFLSKFKKIKIPRGRPKPKYDKKQYDVGYRRANYKDTTEYTKGHDLFPKDDDEQTRF